MCIAPHRYLRPGGKHSDRPPFICAVSSHPQIMREAKQQEGGTAQ